MAQPDKINLLEQARRSREINDERKNLEAIYRKISEINKTLTVHSLGGLADFPETADNLIFVRDNINKVAQRLRQLPIQKADLISAMSHYLGNLEGALGILHRHYIKGGLGQDLYNVLQTKSEDFRDYVDYLLNCSEEDLIKELSQPSQEIYH
jgi:hypothetical protein